MKFKYYEFGEEIYSSVFKECSGENQIFIFNGETEKNSAKFDYFQNFKFEDNILMTMQELKDMIFPSTAPLLREEKRILIFYKVLNEDEREFFGIKNYFDSIDIANNFFILMSELTESESGDIYSEIELNEKQIQIYEKFQNIKLKYIEKLKELDFNDYISLNKIENIECSSIVNYKKIVFVNIPYFTRFEKKIINKISEYMESEIHIFKSEKSYCEENLCIENIELNKKSIKKNNLKIRRFDDKFIETASLAESVKLENKSVLVECDKDSGYTEFLSVNLFARDNSIEFTETLLFKFIASLYNLYSSMELIDGNRFLNGEKLLELLLFKEFREYFNIESNKEIISIIEDGNKYINSSVKSVLLIFNEMEKIDSVKTVGEFLNYLLSIDISKFKEQKYSNTEEVYFSAIFEMSSMETMKILEESDYELFFGKRRSENIFRLILKFLRFKKIKMSYIKEKTENKIVDFKSCDTILKGFDKIIFLNMIEGIIPSKKVNNFLFTEEQRKKLGFITYEQKRNYEKFKFTSLLNSVESAEIFTIYNESKNIGISSFIEEIMINLKLTDEKREENQKYYSDVTDSLYRNYNNFNFKIEECIKENEKLENLKIGYYDFNNLKICNYKFYLKKIEGVEKEYPKISYSPEMAVIGIIVHDIFRVVFEKIKKEGIDNFSKENSIKIIQNRIKENREKFPVPYIPYYEKIIAEHIAESICFFIEENRVRIESADIFPEQKIEKEIENGSVKISGRVDLISVKNGYTSIFDYKTGSGNMEQLDFYQAVINKESDEEIIDKIIYSVFKMENEVSQKTKLTASEIEEVIRAFIKSSSYKKNPSEKECSRCEYKEICRPEEIII